MQEDYDLNDPSVPESLKEVWRWKIASRERHKGKTLKQMIKDINESGERLLRERGIVLPIFVPEPREAGKNSKEVKGRMRTDRQAERPARTHK